MLGHAILNVNAIAGNYVGTYVHSKYFSSVELAQQPYRLPLSYHLATIGHWLPLGYHLATTWLPLGYHLATT